MRRNRNNVDWRQQVQAFAGQLERTEGLHSVKDLCRFLLEEQHWTDDGQVLRYLHDYRQVSQAHFAFHEQWRTLTNMANIAEYDRREIEKVSELLTLLGEPDGRTL